MQFYNVTGTIVLKEGPNVFTNNTDSFPDRAHVWGKFTLGSGSICELQHRAQTTKSTDGFGNANSWGTEIYADLRILKVG